MQVWGKVLGGIFGFMFGRVPGALLGLVVGHFFDVSYSRDFSKQGGFSRFFNSTDDIAKQAIFFHALFSSLGHLCKSDGAITKQDIDIASSLMDEMGLRGDVRTEAQDAFREGKDLSFPLADMLTQFKQSIHSRRDIIQLFLEILIRGSCARGRLSAPKFSLLQKIAKLLDVSKTELNFLVTAFEAEQRFRRSGRYYQKDNAYRRANGQSSRSPDSSKSDLQDAYNILGVDDKCSNGDVKKAYKKLMSIHHPDKIASKGLPKQALLIAKEKAQDIQAAYALIKKSRGM